MMPCTGEIALCSCLKGIGGVGVEIGPFKGFGFGGELSEGILGKDVLFAEETQCAVVEKVHVDGKEPMPD